jgi:hypothetical protein
MWITFVFDIIDFRLVSYFVLGQCYVLSFYVCSTFVRDQVCYKVTQNLIHYWPRIVQYYI